VEAEAGRFRLHDLLRLFANERATAEETSTEREAALHRAMVYYLGTSRRAVLLFSGLERPMDPALAGPEGDDLVPLPTLPDAAVWMDAEWPCVLAIAEQTGETSGAGSRYPAQLLRATAHHMMRHNRWSVLEHLANLTLTARAPDDLTSEAIGANILGHVYMRTERLPAARQQLEHASKLWHRLGDLDSQATAWNSLATLAKNEGNLEEAIICSEACLVALRRLGARQLESYVLGNMAEVQIELGLYSEAIASHQLSLSVLSKDSSPIYSNRITHGILARLQTLTGDFRAALRSYARSLRVARHFAEHTAEREQLLCREPRPTCVCGVRTWPLRKQIEYWRVPLRLASSITMPQPCG
jgi:tetratricopeptide (TPR) repeat protein